MGNDNRVDLRNAILLYLKNNPNAADSLEGIMRWWVPQKNDELDIKQILEQLVAEGLIEERFLVDGTILYRQSG